MEREPVEISDLIAIGIPQIDTEQFGEGGERSNVAEDDFDNAVL